MIAIIGNAEQASRALGEPLAGREGRARAGQRDAAGSKAQAVAGREAVQRGWRHHGQTGCTAGLAP